MKTLPALLSLAAGSVSGQVLDVCAGGNGTWLAVRCGTEIGEEASTCLFLVSEGGSVFVDTLGIVRSDAAKCCLTRRDEGGCYAAVSIGTGYTAVSLRAYGPDGAREWEIIEDGFCYDAPTGLFATSDGGAVLLWDSFSSERGLWAMRVSPAGETVWKTFALPTYHPDFTAFCPMADGSFLLAASTEAAMDDRAVAAVGSSGVVESFWTAGSLEALGAVTPVGIWTARGVPLSAWSGETTPVSLDELVMTTLLEDGATGESWRFKLNPVTGAMLVQAAPGGGFIFCGVEELPWVCGCDRTGSVTWRSDFGICFTPAAMTMTPSGTVVVAGDREDGFIVVEVDPATGVLWTFPGVY